MTISIADFKAMGESAGAISGGVSGLGSSELAQTLAKASAAINMAAGIAEIAAVAVSLMQKDNLRVASEAVATATAVSALPMVGWGRIAMATAATATVGATVGALLTYRLRGDLSTPSGRTAVAQMVGGIV